MNYGEIEAGVPGDQKTILGAQGLEVETWDTTQQTEIVVLNQRNRASRVPEQRLESIIHVLLDMAMEERKPRLIRSKVDHRAPEIRHHHRIFHQPGRGLPVDLNHFPQ